MPGDASTSKFQVRTPWCATALNAWASPTDSHRPCTKCTAESPLARQCLRPCIGCADGSPPCQTHRPPRPRKPKAEPAGDARGNDACASGGAPVPTLSQASVTWGEMRVKFDTTHTLFGWIGNILTVASLMRWSWPTMLPTLTPANAYIPSECRLCAQSCTVWSSNIDVPEGREN